MEELFSMEKCIEKMKQSASSMGIELRHRPSAVSINWFEQKMGIKLPDDFRQFYHFSDGTEGDNDMFRMIPLDEMIENERIEQSSPDVKDFHFAEYMIYCDMWTVSIDKTDRNNYVIYNIGADGRADYTNTLAEFLERYLNGGVYDGIYEWQDEIKRSKS